MFRLKTPNHGEVEIRFYHTRPDVVLVNKNNNLSSMKKSGIKYIQGKTECFVSFTDRRGLGQEYVGVAHTHPNDQFTKRTGRELAISRAIDTAIEQGAMTEDHACEVYASYQNRHSV